MGTLEDKLNYLKDTKVAIKNAIINKGVDVTDSDTFRSYADKIDSIQTGGGGGGGEGEYVPKELPPNLTQIEYIKQDAGVSTSGYPIPYIPNMNTRLEMKFAITGWSSASTSNNRQVFGGYTGTNGDNIFGLVATRTDNILTAMYGTILQNRKYAKLVAPVLNTDYTLIMTTSKVTLNNVDYEYNYVETEDPLPDTWVANNPLYIFPGAPVSVSYISWNKLYYAKVYDGDELKYDLIPVKNNVSGYGGLFDRVTGGYFENTDYVYSFENGPEVHNVDITLNPIDGGTITGIRTTDGTVTSSNNKITVSVNTPIIATTSNGTELYAITNKEGKQTIDVYTTDISTSDEADTIGKVYVRSTNNTDNIEYRATYYETYGDETSQNLSGVGEIVADPREAGGLWGYNGILSVGSANCTATNSNGSSNVTFETESLAIKGIDTSFKSGHYVVIASK